MFMVMLIAVTIILLLLLLLLLIVVSDNTINTGIVGVVVIIFGMDYLDMAALEPEESSSGS
jgi:uncharacterized membrane protein